MTLYRKRRTFLVFFGVILFACVGSALVALHSMRLEKIGYRDGVYKLTEEQRKVIESECQDIKDIEDLINKCNKLVCRQLSFAYRNSIDDGKANCIGYAMHHAAVLNHAFKINHLPYKARQVYGRAYLWGIDLHPFFKAIVPEKYEQFFSYHDYTEIEMGEEYLYVDTSIQDLLGYEYSKISTKH